LRLVGARDARPELRKENTMELKQIFPFVLGALCLNGFAVAGTSFQHIIVVVQENRTPDNLFQGLCARKNTCSVPPGPGEYDILTSAWLDKTSRGGTTNPTPVPLGVGYDLSHRHDSFVTMCDFSGSGACAMDGAANVKCKALSQQCPSKPAYGYVENSRGAVQPYLDLVHDYGWGNYMFQTNQGPSFSGASIPVRSDFGSLGG
jgi:hypothetical protein